jgi:hypothetical protein
MTESEARARCAELASEHPERETHRWFAREEADGWEVVKVAMPDGMRIRPLTPAVEAKPKPPQADDPRSAFDRNVGGPWVAGS